MARQKIQRSDNYSKASKSTMLGNGFINFRLRLFTDYKIWSLTALSMDILCPSMEIPLHVKHCRPIRLEIV